MNNKTKTILEKLIEDIPAIRPCMESITKAFEMLLHCYLAKGKILICGNGGSSADADHIVGELMKSFVLKRDIDNTVARKLKTLFPAESDHLIQNLQGALPAISLSGQTALLTAFINDVSPDMAYAQQVYGYGLKGDVLIGLSTSGNSANVVNAIKVAKALDMNIIGFTGQDGGIMKPLCDLTITVPARETYRVQEYHLPVYHALCAMLEAELF